MSYYQPNKKFNKPQLVLQHSGIFESDKRTVVVFLDDILKNDLRKNNVLDMFQPVIILELHDESKEHCIKKYFNNLNLLLAAYTPYFNVILCVEDLYLLKKLMNYGYGKKEALLTGATYEINMSADWKKKKGLFLNSQYLSLNS